MIIKRVLLRKGDIIEYQGPYIIILSKSTYATYDNVIRIYSDIFREQSLLEKLICYIRKL